MVARPLTEKLRGRYAESLVLDSRPGAGGRIAVDFVKRAAPDGKTILQIPGSIMTSRIYRWYGALQRLERDASRPSADAMRREELMRHLDQLENSVVKIVVPAAYGDLFYGLRGHIAAVRKSLLDERQSASSDAAQDDAKARVAQPTP